MSSRKRVVVVVAVLNKMKIKIRLIIIVARIVIIKLITIIARKHNKIKQKVINNNKNHK